MKIAGILAALAALLAILLVLIEVVLRFAAPQIMFGAGGVILYTFRNLLLSGSIVIIGGAMAFTKTSAGAAQQ